MHDQFGEMVANINTQLRFGRHREALVAAYELRIALQMCNETNEEIQSHLRMAEEVIETFERRKAGRFSRWIKSILVATAEAFERSSGPATTHTEPETPPTVVEAEEQVEAEEEEIE